jgi:hypothetical protein
MHARFFIPVTTLRALLAAALLLAGAGVPAVLAQALTGKVTLVAGTVEYAAPGGGYQAVARGDILAEGTTVRTGPGSRAVIVAGPGAAIRIGPGSTVILSNLALEQALAGATSADDMLIDIKEGTVSALIDRAKQPGANFQVRTPQGVAAARGTIYAVTVRGNRSYAKVQRGTVRITNYASR